MNGREVPWKFLEKKCPTLASKSNLLFPQTKLSEEEWMEAQKWPPARDHAREDYIFKRG